MAKTFIRYILMYVILVVSQAVVFNHICLFGVAIPLVFIYLIIKLPMTLSNNWTMTVGFLLGVTIDILSDTQGMNALACTTTAGMRRSVLRLYFPREEEMSDSTPSMRSLGEAVFLKYAFSITVLYCALFFIIESFTFFNPVRLILKIVSSSLLTFIIIFAIDSLTSKNREKRL